MPLTEADLILAKLAVELGLVTQSQVDACLREGIEDPKATGGTAWTLGDLLLRRGFLSEEGRVQVQKTHAERLQKAMQGGAKKEDILFGRLCVAKKFASPVEVNECLELQQRMTKERKGGELMTAPRIGELMIERGYLSPDQVKLILQEQRKFLVRCPGCGRQFNVVGLRPGQQFPCKKCNATVTVSATARGVAADETVFFSGQDALDKGKQA